MDILMNTWSESQRRALVFRAGSNGEGEKQEDARDVLTFYDVDFATIWPRTSIAQRPKGRPGATTRRHVLDIEHDDYVVVSSRTRDAHTVTPACRRGNDGPIVGTHEELPFLR